MGAACRQRRAGPQKVPLTARTKRAPAAAGRRAPAETVCGPSQSRKTVSGGGWIEQERPKGTGARSGAGAPLASGASAAARIVSARACTSNGRRVRCARIERSASSAKSAACRRPCARLSPASGRPSFVVLHQGSKAARSLAAACFSPKTNNSQTNMFPTHQSGRISLYLSPSPGQS